MYVYLKKKSILIQTSDVPLPHSYCVQGFGILFRSVKFSVFFPIKFNQCSVTRSSKNGRL